MEEFQFIKFDKTNARSEDRITVTGHNSFGFPTKFYKEENIGQYKYAIIYYDTNRKAVGLQFTNSDEEKHKFSILKSKQGYGGSIVATSFFKSYNIDPKIYHGRYAWEKREQPGVGTLYVIELKEHGQGKNQLQEDVNPLNGEVPEG